MAKSLMGKKMIDPARQMPYHHNVKRIAMKKLFANPDPEEARKFLIKYFNEVMLPEDGVRDEDEEAAREHMFNKLTDLARVVEEVKKGLRKKP